MSLILGHDSRANKPSEQESEHISDSDPKLEEGSTTLEEDTVLSIWYPSPPYFPKPYLCNQDFRDLDKALKYIMKNFNFKTVRKSLWSFPNISLNPLYYNIFVDPSHYKPLQQHIDESIYNCNALLQKWLEVQARYSISDDINPFITQCIL